MKRNILLFVILIVASLFLFSCSPEQETAVDDYIADLEDEVAQGADDLQETIDEGIAEAIAEDSVLDTGAAELAPATLGGQCVVPEYPGSSIDTNNAADILNSAGSAGISQAAYLSLDDESTIMDWFDLAMNEPWFVEREWNRGSKTWVTGDFDIVGQLGCSAMLSIEENQQGSTTIGVVVMDFS